MTGVTLEKFHKFPKLPTELRLKIWKATFPRPRIIPLGCSYRNTLGNYGLKWFQPSFAPPTPISLHVNSESREEALKSYELCFESSGFELRIIPKIYVNFAEDIFFILGRDGDYLSICVPIISSDIGTDTRAAMHRGDYHQFFRFISPQSASDFHKIQRLMLGTKWFDKQFLIRGRDPKPYYGLPLFLKELLLISAVDGRRLLQYPGIEFVEDQEEEENEEEEEDVGLAVEQAIRDPGYTWWVDRKKEVKKTFETAKENNPGWKAPTLKFGRDKVRMEMD